LESFLSENSVCIVTEYCEGGDLEKRLNKLRKEGERLSEEKIYKWLVQLISAFNYIHNFSETEAILHRNLKPANIFLKNENIKIGDFGISRILLNGEQATSFIGTPYYMSPEVIDNKTYGSKSDIWSLGCILYEMATFQHPFVADNVYGIFNSVIKEKTPSISHIYSKSLNEILQR
jgi:NIMA (never in mitosis gene a)-related kinase